MEKAPDAFRTISEVADELDLPQHVLRFWETRFSQIKPMKRGGGRRYYRPDDVDLLRGIRHLLYGEGYTIRGVQRILKDHGIKFVQSVWQVGAPQPAKSAADLAEPESGAEATQHGRETTARLSPAPRRADADPETSEEDDDDEDAPAASGAPAMARQNEKIAAEKAGLVAEEVAKLEATLSELVECRRLLGELLPDNN